MGVNPKLRVGDRAPNFKAHATAGSEAPDQEIQLSDFLDQGNGVILYFYPKDNTPGCTTQACDFRDAQDDLKAQGYTVVGVSPDSVKSHVKFQTKHDFSFTLVSDPEHSIAEDYGVWREKKNYGKTYMGIVRSTFVIAPDGTLQEIHDNVRAKGHVERIVKGLSEVG